MASPPTDPVYARRPASVNSRSAHTRRHRTGRSHSGGTSFKPQNEFPNFAQTGDVEIIISVEGQEKRYMLHRLILAQSSGFFEAGTSEDWARAQARAPPSGSADLDSQTTLLSGIAEDEESPNGFRTSKFQAAREREKLRWKYELDWGNNDEVPMLVQKVCPLWLQFNSVSLIKQPPTATLFGGDPLARPSPMPNKPQTSASGFFRSMTNRPAMQSASHIPHIKPQADQDNDVIRDYDNLFRIFYNFPPALDLVNIAESYIQCKTLLALADMYDALEVVGPRIDHHLLQFQGKLWKQIAKYPPSYLKLGFLARSKVIFTEALIHVVGQWPSGSNSLRHNLPESVLEIIEDKVEELKEMKEKTEARLFRLALTTPKGERVSPSNAYLDWQALSLFRHWLAENTTPPPPPIPKVAPNAEARRPIAPHPQPPPLNSGTLYRLLGTGGSSYLGHDELKRFLRIRPDDYTRDSLKKFEKRMDEIKCIAREVVKPLLRNYLELDMGKDGGALGYLTCTKIDEADFPWDT